MKTLDERLCLSKALPCFPAKGIDCPATKMCSVAHTSCFKRLNPEALSLKVDIWRERLEEKRALQACSPVPFSLHKSSSPGSLLTHILWEQGSTRERFLCTCFPPAPQSSGFLFLVKKHHYSRAKEISGTEWQRWGFTGQRSILHCWWCFVQYVAV